MRWLASLAAAAALLGAAACDAADYAIVSLIGSEITIVGAQPVSSTSLDRNSYSPIPVKDATFDRAVFNAVDRAIVARNRHEKSSLLRMPADDARAAFIDGAKSAVAAASVVDAVRPAAAQAGLARMVLVAPYRYAPMMRTAEGHVGTGRVAGLGVYVDRMTRFHQPGVADVYPGYLGLFANFRVLVVDLASGAVLAEDVVTTGTTYATSRSASRDPMAAITAEEKLRVLQRLIDVEMARVLPPLLAKADP